MKVMKMSYRRFHCYSHHTYLTVVDIEVQVVQGMVCGSIDGLLEDVSRYHIGIMNLHRVQVSTI